MLGCSTAAHSTMRAPLQYSESSACLPVSSRVVQCVSAVASVLLVVCAQVKAPRRLQVKQPGWRRRCHCVCAVSSQIPAAEEQSLSLLIMPLQCDCTRAGVSLLLKSVSNSLRCVFIPACVSQPFSILCPGLLVLSVCLLDDTGGALPGRKGVPGVCVLAHSLPM